MDVLEDGMVRTTVNFLKVLRKQNWEKGFNWDHKDVTREYTTKQMLQEKIQDYMCPLVIGSDVV